MTSLNLYQWFGEDGVWCVGSRENSVYSSQNLAKRGEVMPTSTSTTSLSYSHNKLYHFAMMSPGVFIGLKQDGTGPNKVGPKT